MAVSRFKKPKLEEGEKQEDSNIGRIYSEGQEKKVNMTRLERGKSGRKRKAVIIAAALLVFLTAVALAGFFLFNRGQTSSGQSISISIEAPKKIASGDDVQLEISYLNKDAVKLTGAELSIIYPEGFYILESSPDPVNEGRSVWSLGDIMPGAGGKVAVSGQMIGNIGDTKTFQVTCDYTPENFSSAFQEKEAHSLEITSSILELEAEVPMRAVEGQEVEFIYNLTNNSENPLLKIRLDFSFPEGFSFISAEPAAKEGYDRFLIDQLDAKNSRQISIKGSLSGSPGDSKEIKVLYGLVAEGGLLRRQGEASSIIYIVQPELNLTYKVNDSIQESPVDAGDKLEYTVKYKNASDVLISDLILTASFSEDVEVIKFSSLEDEHSGVFDEEEKTITWDKDQIAEFSSIKPQDEGEFSFTLLTKENFSPTTEEDKHLVVKSKVATASMSIDELGDFEQNSESNEVITKINSRVSLEARGWYYSEDYEKVGDGPLPPRVGETTTYRITWDASSLYNDLQGVEVAAKLPKDVFYTGRAYSSEGGVLNFDADSRQVTWKINNIPANTGYLFSPYSAYFDVSVTPESRHVGKQMILMEKSALTGRDGFTGEEVSAEDKVVTTILENDNLAEGKGIVAPAQNANSNRNSNSNKNSNTNSGCSGCGNN